jgi:hypothetical protein
MIIIENILMADSFAMFPAYPKNLSFNLKRLEANLIRSKIIINGDKTSYNAGDRATLNFPVGRMYDQRSVVLTAKCSTTASSGNYFPRGGLNSLIENLQITANQRVLQSTQGYNYIWNILADLTGYYSPEQEAKRLYENFDPSIRHTNVQGEGTPVLSNKHTTEGERDEYYFCVNQWLGYLSSSAATQNTNDLGQIVMTLTFAPNSCVWLGQADSTPATLSITSYKIEELTLTMDGITFTDSFYQDLVKQKLESDGLKIGYNDYIMATGNSVAKSTTGINHTAQFNTSSLDMLIATFRPSAYDTAGPLLLHTPGSGALTYPEVVFNPVGRTGTHGGFNNSVYFRRDGAGIDSSSWFVNSSPFSVNTNPIGIYNGMLQSLDFANIDIASGGLHKGCLTTGFFCSHYFADIISLENLAGDNNNYISGYDGDGGVISVQYRATFKSGVSGNVIPVIIAKVSKELTVKMGRALDLRE